MNDFRNWVRRDQVFADARDLFLIGQEDRALQQLKKLEFGAAVVGPAQIPRAHENRHAHLQRQAMGEIVRTLYALDDGHTTLRDAIPRIGNLLQEVNHQAGLAYQLAQEERLAHQMGELELQSPPADNFSRDEPDAQ